jgi:hypothetical protein
MLGTKGLFKYRSIIPIGTKWHLPSPKLLPILFFSFFSWFPSHTQPQNRETWLAHIHTHNYSFISILCGLIKDCWILVTELKGETSCLLYSNCEHGMFRKCLIKLIMLFFGIWNCIWGGTWDYIWAEHRYMHSRDFINNVSLLLITL